MTDDKRQLFETAYEGKPPWDLGRPQQPFIDHADQIAGRVLDVGCGTGEHALFFAERGQEVLGVDFVEKPLEVARLKAKERCLQANFRQFDATKLGELDRQFDSIIDCGLFHVFSDEDRALHVQGLAEVTNPGGQFFLMCFSNQQGGEEGPRRISQEDLRDAFADGWTIESIEPARFAVNPDADRNSFGPDGPKAWFAVIRRNG